MSSVEQPTFASRFRAVLAAKPELTKYRLAQLSGVNESQLGKIEKGKSLPSEETLVKLAPHLGVDLADLVAWAAEERLAVAIAKDPELRTDFFNAVTGSLRQKVAERLRQISELESSLGQFQQIQGIFEAQGETDTEPAKLIAEAKAHAEVALKVARAHVVRLESRLAEGQKPSGDSKEVRRQDEEPAEPEPPVGADLRPAPKKVSRKAWCIPADLKEPVTKVEVELMKKLDPSTLGDLGPQQDDRFWHYPRQERIQRLRHWVSEEEEFLSDDAEEGTA